MVPNHCPKIEEDVKLTPRLYWVHNESCESIESSSLNNFVVAEISSPEWAFSCYDETTTAKSSSANLQKGNCHMTTKHVVEDGVLGKIARKQWEIQRRILEGTLSPDEVIRKLQSIVENAPNTTFDVERVNYTVGEKVYEVSTHVKKDFCEYVAEIQRYGVFGKTFLDDLENYKTMHYGELTAPSTRTIKRRLRLAQVTGRVHKSVIVIQARQSGHILADPWDLLAFFQQSSFREIVHSSMTVYALGGDPLMEWWDAEGTGDSRRAGIRKPLHLKVIGHDKAWSLEETERKDDPHYPLSSDFFLIREK
jgi:hypothetical protein